MSREEIVEQVAREGWIEECIKVVSGGTWRFEYKDLVQDLLVELLKMDFHKLAGLYRRNQLRYYIMKMVRNNIQSKTSRFYYQYRKFSFLNAGPGCRALLEVTEDEQD